jgi:hypothetical protein
MVRCRLVSMYIRRVIQMHYFISEIRSGDLDLDVDWNDGKHSSSDDCNSDWIPAPWEYLHLAETKPNLLRALQFRLGMYSTTLSPKQLVDTYNLAYPVGVLALNQQFSEKQATLACPCFALNFTGDDRVPYNVIPQLTYTLFFCEVPIHSFWQSVNWPILNKDLKINFIWFRYCL